ncbi:hypothetical protein [Clostridium omnivorum]|uniref:Uncharacterized protein n=1 Tax=Clostridium omnivorum TaxID=1604902 RepID=A0ABQ5NAE5_9CLOT|nr:hypothetical protein [Clostridium sp. E14]GLC32161.1 hypothetical protein bsdE14_35710 [Clostridium sp. E14]
MNSYGTEKYGLSNATAFETEDISIDEFSDTDDFDNMEMMPFPSATAPIEPIEIYSNNSAPIEQVPMEDILNLDYNSAYMYDYPMYTEMDIDYDVYNFDNMEFSEMFEPWDSITDMVSQNEETNCNNNLENINDYSFINQDNSRAHNDYSSPKIPSDINEILRNIETFNPGILRKLMVYGIPYDTARRIIRRIICLTLDYCR